MKDEYIIINKSQIEKRIERLEKNYIQEPEEDMKSWLAGGIGGLKEVLSQSTPLIPEIRKAFYNGGDMKEKEEFDFYISNLKLDI